MEWGLQVAGNAGLSRLTIEINSQEVANFVNNKQSNMKEIVWVVSEIQNLIKDFQIKIQYMPRSCNVIAHSLTKLALKRCENVVSMGLCPSELM